MREKISQRIQWKPEADRDKFFENLEALAFGLAHRENPEAVDPRHACTRLESVIKAMDNLEREFRQLDKLQSKTGSVRMLPTWSRLSEDGKTLPTWDEVSDARGTLNEFASAARLAVERFRSSMKTSPRKVNPTLGWARQVWIFYQKVDSDPKIGKRDHQAGRFQSLLYDLAEPLEIELHWLTIQRHLQEERREAIKADRGPDLRSKIKKPGPLNRESGE